MTKQEIRNHIKSLVPSSRQDFSFFSEQICNKISQSNAFKDADIILAYMALSDEVDLSRLISQAVAEKKQVFIPRIIAGTSQMDFYKYNPEKTIQEGSYGILEPDKKEQMLEIKSYSEKILVLVPGRAFTKEGFRLGRGKGFYDIFLEKLFEKNPLNLKTAGICFSFQILDEIPVEAHDKTVNFLFSN